MSHVRPFERSDIPAVADLFARVFRDSPGPAPESLRSYIDLIYLQNPWRRDDLPSLVSVARDGHVTGFIGSMPRTMMFRGREIRLVVPGNHMVDPDARDPLAGALLLRRLLAGPQDLTLTDTANEVSRRLWERSGGRVIKTLSRRWVRPLRPVSLALSIAVRQREIPRNVATVLPRAADFFLGPLSAANLLVSRDPFKERDLTPEDFIRDVHLFTRNQSLVPVYTLESASWLFDRAREKRAFGPLLAKSLHIDDTLAGLYLMYARRGSLAEVLHLAASPAHSAAVLRHVARLAHRIGCLALVGLWHPTYAAALRQIQAVSFLRLPVTVAHARDAQILQALEAGDVSFSRLEGEWWTRLQGDTFD